MHVISEYFVCDNCRFKNFHVSKNSVGEHFIIVYKQKKKTCSSICQLLNANWIKKTEDKNTVHKIYIFKVFSTYDKLADKKTVQM